MFGAHETPRYDAQTLARALGGEARGNRVVAPGPGHSPHDRSMSILFDPHAAAGFVVNSFAGDDVMVCRDYIRARLGLGEWKPDTGTASTAPRNRLVTADADNTYVARFLWRQAQQMEATPAANYLRSARRYGGKFPPTLRYLPARGKHPSAMIAAFGIASEVEPGVLSIAEGDVVGVHLTKLLPDGSRKIEGESAKIMVGRASRGFPIVLVPPNDVLGLAITEGIEDALSVHEATGLGAWAAGCANRLPALAEHVPDYIDCVTAFGHDDGGRKYAMDLGTKLKLRGFNASVKFLRAPASDAI